MIDVKASIVSCTVRALALGRIQTMRGIIEEMRTWFIIEHGQGCVARSANLVSSRIQKNRMLVAVICSHESTDTSLT